MEVGNDINLTDGEQWSFYNGVAKHFDDHVRLSVPLYEEGHKLICYLSDFFLKDDSSCYEIGSSTGTLIKKLYQRHHNKNNITFYGVEPVKEMIEIAQNNDNTEIEYINDSIENINMTPANLIVGYYFLQFIPISKRKEVIQKIYDALVPGVGFILFEKELPLDPKIYKLVTSSYMKFKIDHGFSPEEVLSKQFSLVTNTHSENRRLLSSAGFSHITTVMKYGEFNGYLCFK